MVECKKHQWTLLGKLYDMSNDTIHANIDDAVNVNILKICLCCNKIIRVKNIKVIDI